MHFSLGPVAAECPRPLNDFRVLPPRVVLHEDSTFPLGEDGCVLSSPTQSSQDFEALQETVQAIRKHVDELKGLDNTKAPGRFPWSQDVAVDLDPQLGHVQSLSHDNLQQADINLTCVPEEPQPSATGLPAGLQSLKCEWMGDKTYASPVTGQPYQPHQLTYERLDANHDCYIFSYGSAPWADQARFMDLRLDVDHERNQVHFTGTVTEPGV